MDDLRGDLARTQRRGFSLDDEESVEGLRCVAVPIRDATGTARYAMSVSGPSYRLLHSRLVQIGETLRSRVQPLEALLHHDLSGTFNYPTTDVESAAG